MDSDSVSFSRSDITGASLGSAREFLGVHATTDPTRFQMPVTQALGTWARNLFGGAGLGGAVEALETYTGRPLIWATAQYLSFARVGSILDIDVDEVVRGNATSQARVVIRHGDQEVLTVNAALGSRTTEASGSFAVMPDVAPPLSCPVREHRFGVTDSINEHIQARVAVGRKNEELDGTPSVDGRSALWARLPGVAATSAAGLAVLGDFVPFGIGQALGLRAGGTSLDNTLRMVKLVATEWVLLDIRVHAVHYGFGHGLVHLWAEDGTLLATASQSTTVKFWDRQGTPKE